MKPIYCGIYVLSLLEGAVSLRMSPVSGVASPRSVTQVRYTTIEEKRDCPDNDPDAFGGVAGCTILPPDDQDPTRTLPPGPTITLTSPPRCNNVQEGADDISTTISNTGDMLQVNHAKRSPCPPASNKATTAKFKCGEVSAEEDDDLGDDSPGFIIASDF
ncbi:hypothetical protein F5Y13DRAFT_190738 [Hypoxylon sp. FL1857]|nr:hypothetical protein F5Y13DRAFT_190738 [Hypoxylon sp. FL1857]